MTPEGATVTPYSGLPTLYLAHDAARVEKTGAWYRNFQYAAEQERGLDFAEDLFNPMLLQFDLGSRQEANVIASAQTRTVAKAADYRAAEMARRSAVRATAPASDIFVETLTAASDQFIVARGPEDGAIYVVFGNSWMRP